MYSEHFIKERYELLLVFEDRLDKAIRNINKGKTDVALEILENEQKEIAVRINEIEWILYGDREEN